MEWEELKQFAENIKQTWDCLVVASSRDDKRTRPIRTLRKLIW